MSIRIGTTCLLILAVCSFAAGQHGDAGFTSYSIFWAGHIDSWKGTVTSVDRDKGTITLTYEHKGKTETFTGALSLHPAVFDHTRLSHLYPEPEPQIGDLLDVDYIPKGQKFSRSEPTKRGSTTRYYVADDNLIITINFLHLTKR